MQNYRTCCSHNHSAHIFNMKHIYLWFLALSITHLLCWCTQNPFEMNQLLGQHCTCHLSPLLTMKHQMGEGCYICSVNNGGSNLLVSLQNMTIFTALCLTLLQIKYSSSHGVIWRQTTSQHCIYSAGLQGRNDAWQLQSMLSVISSLGLI